MDAWGWIPTKWRMMIFFLEFSEKKKKNEQMAESEQQQHSRECYLPINYAMMRSSQQQSRVGYLFWLHQVYDDASL